MRRRRQCPTGKQSHATVDFALISARSFAIDLNAQGQYHEPFYGYRCPACRRWHTTRRAAWNGEPNVLLVDTPRDLQAWAITGVRP